MNNNRIEAMEKNEKTASTIRDADNEKEPQINYRGVKAMPFIIGKKCAFFYLFLSVNCRPF